MAGRLLATRCFPAVFAGKRKRKTIIYCFMLLFLQFCSRLLQRCILFICNHSLWGTASCISTGHWRMWAYIYVNLVSYLFGTKCSRAQKQPSILSRILAMQTFEWVSERFSYYFDLQIPIPVPKYFLPSISLFSSSMNDIITFTLSDKNEIIPGI